MKTTKQNLGMGRTLLALAVLGAIGHAQAQQSDEVKQLTNPDSSVTVGVAGVNGDSADRAQYGMYNGMRKESGYLLFDIDYLRRDNATGTWSWLTGRNLGTDARELRGGMNRQGDWKVYGAYSEITRYSPFTANTGMTNFGSTAPNIVAITKGGTGSDYDFKMQRKAASAGFDKWISKNLKFEASVKSEDKNGTRLWGRGYDCAGYVCGTSTTTAMNQANFLKNAILMIPEPVDSNIKQFDARLAFNSQKLNVTAAYYGSFYTNANGNISPIVPNALYGGNQTLVGALYPAVGTNIIAGGGLSLQQVLASPLALPPDNQAHQYSISGNYAFTPSTRATFRYAYTHATQDESFAGMGFTGAPAGFNNYGGKLETTAAQMGLTSRINKDLTVLGNISYSDKKDKSPKGLYNVEAKAVFPATTPTSYTNVNQPGLPGANWFNNHISNTMMFSKLEATYRLGGGYRLTAGADYHSHERLVPESRVEEALAGLGPLREKINETGYRIDLKKTMSDTFNGSIGVSTTKRTGSDWTNLSTLNPEQPTPNSAVNTFLINTYCGGQPCYGQTLSAYKILQLSANTPFPMQMADLQRDKVKVTMDWTPLEALSIQFVGEDGKDKNAMPYDPVAGPKGWQATAMNYASLDVTYVLSDKWKLTGYASQGLQTTYINHSTGYKAALRNRTETLGLSLVGEATKQLRVGANLNYINEVNQYKFDASNSTSGDRLTGLVYVAPSAANVAQANVGVPDVVFRNRVISLFGIYNLNKVSDLRFDVVNQKSKYKDWVWGDTANPFVFSDNTTIKQQVDQTVTFVGVTYVFRFR